MSLHYPDPPRTRGMHPETWPTSADLSDAQLLYWLAKTERMDREDRHLTAQEVIRRIGRRGLPEREEHREKRRRGINAMHADLFNEAVRRGLRDPYEAQTPPPVHRLPEAARPV